MSHWTFQIHLSNN